MLFFLLEGADAKTAAMAGLKTARRVSLTDIITSIPPTPFWGVDYSASWAPWMLKRSYDICRLQDEHALHNTWYTMPSELISKKLSPLPSSEDFSSYAGGELYTYLINNNTKTEHSLIWAPIVNRPSMLILTVLLMIALLTLLLCIMSIGSKKFRRYLFCRVSRASAGGIIRAGAIRITRVSKINVDNKLSNRTNETNEASCTIDHHGYKQQKRSFSSSSSSSSCTRFIALSSFILCCLIGPLVLSFWILWDVHYIPKHLLEGYCQMSRLPTSLIQGIHHDQINMAVQKQRIHREMVIPKRWSGIAPYLQDLNRTVSVTLALEDSSWLNETWHQFNMDSVNRVNMLNTMIEGASHVLIALNGTGKALQKSNYHHVCRVCSERRLSWKIESMRLLEQWIIDMTMASVNEVEYYLNHDGLAYLKKIRESFQITIETLSKKAEDIIRYYYDHIYDQQNTFTQLAAWGYNYYYGALGVFFGFVVITVAIDVLIGHVALYGYNNKSNDNNLLHINRRLGGILMITFSIKLLLSALFFTASGAVLWISHYTAQPCDVLYSIGYDGEYLSNSRITRFFQQVIYPIIPDAFKLDTVDSQTALAEIMTFSGQGRLANYTIDIQKTVLKPMDDLLTGLHETTSSSITAIRGALAGLTYQAVSWIEMSNAIYTGSSEPQNLLEVVGSSLSRDSKNLTDSEVSLLVEVSQEFTAPTLYGMLDAQRALNEFALSLNVTGPICLDIYDLCDTVHLPEGFKSWWIKLRGDIDLEQIEEALLATDLDAGAISQLINALVILNEKHILINSIDIFLDSTGRPKKWDYWSQEYMPHLISSYISKSAVEILKQQIDDAQANLALKSEALRQEIFARTEYLEGGMKSLLAEFMLAADPICKGGIGQFAHIASRLAILGLCYFVGGIIYYKVWQYYADEASRRINNITTTITHSIALSEQI